MNAILELPSILFLTSLAWNTEDTHFFSLENGQLTGRVSFRWWLPRGSHRRWEITVMSWTFFGSRQQLWAASALPCPEFFRNPWASHLFVLRNMGDYVFKFLAALMPCNFPERTFVGLFEFWPHLTSTAISYCISKETSPSSKKWEEKNPPKPKQKEPNLVSFY